MNIDQYNAQVATLDIDDIADDENNRDILHRMKNDNTFCEYEYDLWIQETVDGEDSDYRPEGVEDMGWLGYFIGRHMHLNGLYIKDFDPMWGDVASDALVPFLEGVSRNTSIKKFWLLDTDLLNGRVFTALGSFFTSNQRLDTIKLHNCDFGADGCRLFTLALGNSINKTLQHMVLESNGIAEEGLVDIITALSMYPQLKALSLSGNHLSTNGCIALATLLQHSTTKLQSLRLVNNEINDEGIEALVPVLAHHNHLQLIKLCNNRSVTSKGWQHITTILESPNSKLKTLHINP